MNQILEILGKLNPWWTGGKFERGVTREKYLVKMKEYIKAREIVILTGVRRSGKTTLLFQLISDLIKNKGVNPRQILFVNFDEPDLATIDNPIKSVLDTYFQEVCNDSHAYLIFDEIQNIHGWEKWAKTIYDQKKHDLVISGSSSYLLEGKYAALISGRYLKINVFPLDFREYLVFNNLKGMNNKLSLISNKNKIMKLLKQYLTEGGFPRIALEDNKSLIRDILRNYYESIVYKDILIMHDVRHTQVMRELIHYLYSNFTSLYSYKQLSDMLKVDFTTLKEYLGYLRESRMLFGMPIFSYSLKIQSRNNKKIYCIDNGLRNAVSFKFSEDEGRLAENLIFIELKRREKEAYYWQGKGEVDFVVKNKDNSLTAINVTYADEINDREIEALIEFKKEFRKTKELILLTRDTEKKEQGIRFIPLWKWLLEE